MTNEKNHDSGRPYHSVFNKAAHSALRHTAAPLARVARMCGVGGVEPV